MKALRIKRRELFEREAGKVLMELGAIRDATRATDPWPCYIIETRAGPLRLSIHTSLYLRDAKWWKGDNGSPWIAGRFSEVEAAVSLLGRDEVGPFSGKWNHHYWGSWSEPFDYGLNLLAFELSKVLLTKKQQKRKNKQ